MENFGLAPVVVATLMLAPFWPGIAAAGAVITHELRRPERWWLTTPARARRRVDPRCSPKELRWLARASRWLAVPGILGGLLLLGSGPWWQASGVFFSASSAGVMVRASRLARGARVSRASVGLPFAYAATWLAVCVAVPIVESARALVIFSPSLDRLLLVALGTWLATATLVGWQLWIAASIQEGARIKAREALGLLPTKELV